VTSALVRPIALIALVSAAGLLVSACTVSTNADPTSSATTSSSPRATASTQTPTQTPTPTPTDTAGQNPPAAAPAVYTSCDTMMRAENFQRNRDRGWTAWDLVEQQTEPNGSVFDSFPGGRPAGTMACRYGAGPDVATDNVIDLTWAPIDAEQAAIYQAHLESQGFVRIDGAETVQYSVRGTDGWTDADGWAQTYDFTPTGLRWVAIRDELELFAPLA
jgi:hypothetical protein